MRFTTALLAAAAVVAVSAQGNATNATATLPGTVVGLPTSTSGSNGTLSTSPVPSASESGASSRTSATAATAATRAPTASSSSAAGIVYTANSLGAFVLAIGAMAAGQLV